MRVHCTIHTGLMRTRKLVLIGPETAHPKRGLNRPERFGQFSARRGSRHVSVSVFRCWEGANTPQCLSCQHRVSEHIATPSDSASFVTRLYGPSRLLVEGPLLYQSHALHFLSVIHCRTTDGAA